MNAEELMDLIDQTTAPEKMERKQAREFLAELLDHIEGLIEEINDDLGEEDEDEI